MSKNAETKYESMVDNAMQYYYENSDKITQKEIANILGVHPRTFQRWLTKRKDKELIAKAEAAILALNKESEAIEFARKMEDFFQGLD